MDSTTILRSLVCVAATLCLIILVQSNLAFADDDVYDVLQDYDLPVGVLPEGVKGFQLDRKTGKLSVSLSDNCTFSEGKYQLNYESTVRGYLSKGKMSKVEGVSMKFPTDWMDIVEIYRRNNEISFSVGPGKAAFPLEYFEESPQCGCGMNCGHRPARKLMTTP